jgi:AraC family transcriptional regulator
MHVYLDLALFNRTSAEVWGKAAGVRPLREISGRRDAVLSMLLEQLRLELTTRSRPSGLFVQGIAQSLTAHLVRSYTDTAAGPLWRPGLSPAKLRRVTDLMNRQIAQEFDLSSFAKAAGMSEYHFSRVFTKATSSSPSRFFIRLRMEKARRLLRETDRSIAEIGFDVGYSSPSHFAYAFRRETGVSPREYRGK